MCNGADWAKRKDGQLFRRIQLPETRGGNVESTERFVNRIEKTLGIVRMSTKLFALLPSDRYHSAGLGSLLDSFVKLTGL